MQPEPRRAVAYIAARLIAKRNGSAIYDYTGGGGYAPLTAEQLKETLYEFRVKKKTSPIMQLADLFAWPISIGGYHKSNVTYKRLVDDKKLIDCHLPAADIATLGIKYSCWELVQVKP
jgi:hypothetical protein